MKTYFLTGATGAVGSAIVPLLLEDPDCSVRLLIRAESVAALAARLDELIAFWGWTDRPDLRDRMVPLRGDAAEPQFGLDDAAYGRLVADTTHIIHCAASVRMNYPLEEARRSAVGSAQQILALARRIHAQGHLAKVEFVSTVGIAGKRQGVLPETWITEPREFHNTYEQSKAEAEELVRRAIEQEELPITVHRPSMVIGDSKTGKIIHFQIFYFICEFLSGRKTMGLYPDFGEVRLDVIPVDWVADAIVSTSRDATTRGQILHLCSGPDDSPRLSDLKQAVRVAFRARRMDLPADRTLPRRWFALLPRLAALVAPADKRKALGTLPIYLDYLADRQGFGNAEFVRWLGSRNRQLPGWSAYMPTVLGKYLDSRH